MLVRTRNFLLFLVEKNNNSIDFYHLLFCQRLNCSTVKAIVWVSVMILYITLCKISSYIFQIGCEPRVFWPGEELSLESLERLFVNWSEVPGTCSSTMERIASVRGQEKDNIRIFISVSYSLQSNYKLCAANLDAHAKSQ